MKRKKLILSLACSIVLTIALVIFTVVTITSTNNGNGNVKPTSVIDIDQEGDGSIDNPYLIYDVDSFNSMLVGKYLDENSNYINYNETDDEGNYVYSELKNGLNFKLAQNIDFAGVDFVSIFNKGVAFNGTIDGQGFEIQNVNIKVTKDNLASFMYLQENLGFRAHIGLFGKLDGAKIVNLKVSNINIELDKEVLDYLNDISTTFVQDNGDVMFEVTAGLFAGMAFDSTIDVDVQGQFNGYSYSFRENNNAKGSNAVGGLVGAVQNCDLSNSNVDAQFVLAGNGYFVGGLAGKAYETVVADTTVNANISAKYNQEIFVGGAFGYTAKVSVENAEINLIVNEIESRLDSEVIELLSNEKVDETINIAGIICYVRANDDAQFTSLINVNVNADIKIDGVFAGMFVEIWSDSDSDEKFVTVETSTINADVDVLKVYGFARIISNTSILSMENNDAPAYDLKLTGKANFVQNSAYIVSRYIDDVNSTFGNDGYKHLTILLSKDISDKLEIFDRFMQRDLINAKKLDIA